ncbi:hypothetical protein PV05_04778 [Exophiala xenobiotica]|uniref:Uncharacterized protein n=1 Tax=Exophiala xenobiotica TaxID=348802 RepID=A0A0D2F7T5_9EURO|nr:uncharacterized protein PV05_04778 [Exophiala xenobiotica]KIW56094.1 hypothetical protein PV05_04778 [Exophiala xenobiotica]
MLYVTPQAHEAAIASFMNRNILVNMTLLYWAVEKDKIDLLKILLQTNKVDVDICDLYGRTAFLRAARLGRAEAVKLLLWTRKVDINSKDNSGLTPLALAAEHGHAALVRFLLDTGKVDIESLSQLGQTPLSLAAEGGHEAMVKLLVQTEKVDIESRDSKAWTPTCWALSNGHRAVVELLFSSWIADAMSKGRSLDVKRLGLHGKARYSRKNSLHWALPEDDAVKVAKFLASRDEVCLQVTSHSHPSAESEATTPWTFVELMESLVAASKRNLNTTEEGESSCVLRKAR